MKIITTVQERPANLEMAAIPEYKNKGLQDYKHGPDKSPTQIRIF